MLVILMANSPATLARFMIDNAEARLELTASGIVTTGYAFSFYFRAEATSFEKSIIQLART